MERDEFVLATQRGKNEAPDDAALASAVEAAQGGTPYGFFVLERGDGMFLQFDGAKLEYGGGGRLYRYDTGRHAREVGGRFLSGADVDLSEDWREVTGELDAAAEERRVSIRNYVVLGVFVVAVFLAGWFLLTHARGQ